MVRPPERAGNSLDGGRDARALPAVRVTGLTLRSRSRLRSVPAPRVADGTRRGADRGGGLAFSGVPRRGQRGSRGDPAWLPARQAAGPTTPGRMDWGPPA